MKLVEDLRTVSQIDSESFDSVLALFADTSLDSLEKSVRTRDLYEDTNKPWAAALIRILQTLTSALSDARDFDKQLNEFEKLVVTAADEEQSALNGWARIKGELDRLTERFIEDKKTNIKNRFCRVTEFNITVDIRPVFNMQKTDVVECMFPSILKIETSDDSNFLCELYEDELDAMLEGLQQAKEKLEVIKATYGTS